MRARTWIVVGLIAVSAAATRRGSHAHAHDEAAPVAPRRPSSTQPELPALAWHDLPELEPAAREPIAPPEIHDAPALAAALGVELDDAPWDEPNEPTADPRRDAEIATFAGTLRDLETGEPAIGAVVVLSSKIAAEGVVITDEDGAFRIAGREPGEYTATYYYLDQTMVRTGVVLEAGRTHLEPLVFEADPPPPPDDTYRNIPVPGRTFGEALSAVAGEQCDCDGVSFSGVTSLENSYFIDGKAIEVEQ